MYIKEIRINVRRETAFISVKDIIKMQRVSF